MEKLIGIIFVVSLHINGPKGEDWFADGQRSLEDKLHQKINSNVAKNVILFIGDGMGLSTVTSSRIYSGQRSGGHGEEAQLSFEKFPHTGLLKTYNVDSQVSDSAGTATALLTGQKTRFGVLGADHNVRQFKCDSLAGHEVDGMLHWSQQKGKATGVVTTTRLTHATPAALYAHSPWRFWEVDIDVPLDDRGRCEDIAYQLIKRNSGINVILGGGRAYFLPNDTSGTDPEYPLVKGIRGDHRNLIEEWQATKKAEGAACSYVWNDDQFRKVDTDQTEYLLGLFEPDHMQYEADRSMDIAGEPSLSEMVTKAIRILQNKPNGFFLLVEGGRIDHAHHRGNAARAFIETVSMADAVTSALDIVNLDETLVIVTADHSHTLTIGGYPTRGNDILGKVDPVGLSIIAPLDGLPMTTLHYANGPGPTNRSFLETADTGSIDFQQPSSVPLSHETHGGEDVAVYAVGPMAHLLTGVHEQNYVAHVMAYASCVGLNARHCNHGYNVKPAPYSSVGARLNNISGSLFVITLLLLCYG